MIAYWILFPLLFGAALTGLGLGVRRLTVPFTSALLLPLGYATAVVVSTALTYFGATTGFTGPIVIILALAGWIVSWGQLRSAWADGALRRNWHWIAASVIGFLIFGSPVITSGTPTFTGYNQIVDLAPQMSFAWYLGEHGRDHVQGVSTALNFVNSTLSTGYPAGPQSVLGTFPKTFGLDVQSSYQPYLTVVASLIISASYALIRQVTPSRGFAAVGAFAVGQASSLIGYAYIGGIKELTAVAVILTAGAFVATTATPEVKFWRAALPFTIGIAATFSVFSLTVLPWLGVLGLGAFLIAWRTLSMREGLTRAGFAVVAFVILTLPTIFPARDSLSFADLMKNEVGNLAHPLSRWAATGIWITDDHRFALEGTARVISIAIGVCVIILALVGLWTAWRRKAPALIVLWVASIAGMTVLLARMGPWVQLKGMVVASPAMLLLAVVGISTVLPHKKKALAVGAWVAVCGLVFVGVYSDLLRYRSAQLAPYHRISELDRYDKQFAGNKFALMPDWDENAGFIMRDTGIVQAFNYPFEMTDAWRSSPDRPGSQTAWDLDQITPAFVNTYGLIVTRRSPGLSRPPRNYQLITRGRFFDVWIRTAVQGQVSHQAFTGAVDPTEQAKCQAYVKGLPKTSPVTIAPAPSFEPVTTFNQANASKGLEVVNGNAVLTKGHAGVANGILDVGQNPGLYDIYATDVTRRRNVVTVDHTAMPIQRDPSAAPRGQYLGTVSLAAGAHRVKIQAGGTTLRAGSGTKANIGGWIGSITAVPTGGLYPPLISGTASTIKCPPATDWVETP